MPSQTIFGGKGAGLPVAAAVTAGAVLPQTGGNVVLTVAIVALVVLAVWGVSYMVMRKASK